MEGKRKRRKKKKERRIMPRLVATTSASARANKLRPDQFYQKLYFTLAYTVLMKEVIGWGTDPANKLLLAKTSQDPSRTIKDGWVQKSVRSVKIG